MASAALHDHLALGEAIDERRLKRACSGAESFERRLGIRTM